MREFPSVSYAGNWNKEVGNMAAQENPGRHTWMQLLANPFTQLWSTESKGVALFQQRQCALGQEEL